MNLKIALGVILPLVLLVFLTILGVSNIGISSESEIIVDNISSSSLIMPRRATSEDKIPIKKITITNDFFMPRKYELPDILVCLNDNGEKGPVTISTIYKDKRLKSIEYMDPKIIRDNMVDIPRNSEKEIKLYIEPKYIYNYEYEISQYLKYNELVILEKENIELDYPSSIICEYLDSKDIEKSTRIPIVKSDEIEVTATR